MHPRIELVATSGCPNFVHLELVTYKLRACNQEELVPDASYVLILIILALLYLGQAQQQILL